MTETDAIHRQATEAHGRAWTLLEKAGRTDAETAEMIGAAHASLKAWEVAGGSIEAQRGNWLVARAYVDAGFAKPALEFARRTMELTRAHQTTLADFDLAFAKEIAARAWALAGNPPAGEGALRRSEEARRGDQGRRRPSGILPPVRPWTLVRARRFTARSARPDSRGGRQLRRQC